MANTYHSRENRRHRLKKGTLLCLTLASCIIDEASPVTWKFNIDCKLDADRTKVVELQVAEGQCPIRDPFVYETVSSDWSSPATRRQGFPAGRYAFQATAWDAQGQAVASHCESVQLPRDETINLPLQGTAACGDDGDGDGSVADQDGGTTPGGGELTSPDAGFAPDAGSVTGDAGSVCLDDSDRDTDGVLDCVDECPDDGDKSTAGQCGCGMADMDQDADGTSDCVDACPADENKTEPGACGCNAKTTLLPGEKLLVGEYLCGPVDDSVRLTMVEDGNLQLRVDGSLEWASESITDSMGEKGMQEIGRAHV